MSATDSDSGPAPGHDDVSGRSHDWLRTPVQRWLDRRVAESTAVRSLLREIDGRCFAVVLEGPDLTVTLLARSGRLHWLPPGTREPDAALIASPFDALVLARSQSLSDLKKTDARLSGNIHLAEQFARLFALLGPEPEAELAGWIGDIAAHEVAQAGRAALRFLRQAASALEQNCAEYLREEQPVIARSWEVDEFADAVDDLRDGVERAVARLDALEVRRQAGPRSPAGDPRSPAGHR